MKLFRAHFILILPALYFSACLQQAYNPVDPQSQAFTDTMLLRCAIGDGVCEADVSTGADTETLPVSGVGLWLRADDAYTVSSVTIWPDRSGFGAEFAGSGFSISSGAINGRPAVDCPGNSEFIAGGQSQLNSNIYTAFAVFRRAVTGVSHTFINFGGTPDLGFQFKLRPLDELALVKTSAVAIGNGTTTLTDTNRFYMGSATYDAGGTASFYLDGTADGSTTNAQTFTQNGIARVCGRATEFMQGHIAEIIVYTSALGTADREAVECYLSRRYGIAVPHACS